MNLSFNDLRKRDVINLTDGKCFGKITDLVLKFPEGVLQGIVVPADNGFFSRLFNKNNIYISEKKIKKIGGDVIFVDIKCGDLCEISVSEKPKKPPSPCTPCAPIDIPCGKDVFDNEDEY